MTRSGFHFVAHDPLLAGLGLHVEQAKFLVEDDPFALGITELAQQKLGGLVFVERPKSLKAVAEVYASLVGEIIEPVDAEPKPVNEIFSSATHLEDVVNAEQYEEFAKDGDVGGYADRRLSAARRVLRELAARTVWEAVRAFSD